MWPISDVPARLPGRSRWCSRSATAVGRGCREQPGDWDPPNLLVLAIGVGLIALRPAMSERQTARGVLRRTMFLASESSRGRRSGRVERVSCTGRRGTPHTVLSGNLDRHNISPNAIASLAGRSRRTHPSWSSPFRLSSPAALRFRHTVGAADRPRRSGRLRRRCRIVLSALHAFDGWTMPVPAPGSSRPPGRLRRVGAGRRRCAAPRCSMAGLAAVVTLVFAWEFTTAQSHARSPLAATRSAPRCRPRCRDDDAGGQRGVLDVPFGQRGVHAPA